MLLGGTGSNVMSGGLGSDCFKFNGVDLGLTTGFTAAITEPPSQIVDFSAAEGDKIDLWRIDANTTIRGDQAFSFIGDSTFTNAAGQLRFNSGYVEGDINGDALADFSIQVNVTSLTESDFIL